LVERQQKVDIRTKTVDLEQQETITKDSVTIKVNAVLWFRIINPESAIIKVADYNKAVYQFSVSALRNIVGQHTLDEVLKEREQINTALQKIVDQRLSLEV
jgi:regulator of protease activity HflC (stomatin/prohibitin superfamily)